MGYQKTTVSLIGQRAAVSKSDFYKHFESKDDCFFAAYDAAIERIRQSSCSRPARSAEGEPGRTRVRDAIAALLKTARRRPGAGQHLAGRRPAGGAGRL